MPVLPRRRASVALAALLLAGSIGGCGYSFRTPYNREIKTVYVPVFRTTTFRKDLALLLTDNLIKEIERRTPYKVVGTPEGADSALEGTITWEDKTLQVVSPNNLARHLNTLITVEVRWVDLRPGGDPSKMPSVQTSEMAPFYPELGETVELGFQKAINNLVREIVSMMEQPWVGGDVVAPEEPEAK